MYSNDLRVIRVIKTRLIVMLCCVFLYVYVCICVMWMCIHICVYTENCKVPVSNLIGKENRGFKTIVTNFNHERWFIVAQFNRMSRLVIEESKSNFSLSLSHTHTHVICDHPNDSDTHVVCMWCVTQVSSGLNSGKCSVRVL